MHKGKKSQKLLIYVAHSVLWAVKESKLNLSVLKKLLEQGYNCPPAMEDIVRRHLPNVQMASLRLCAAL